jgi:outer membrane protein assembly factor BamA
LKRTTNLILLDLVYSNPYIHRIFAFIARQIITVLFLLAHIKGATQTLDTLYVSGIEISGLEKTKEWFVRREIRFSEGDVILRNDLDHIILLIKTDLRKTNLFLKIDVEIVISYEEKAEIRFRILLEENWFIYPALIFELADRNFNVWWDDHNHSLKRINVGFGLDHVNLTGSNDKLRLKYQFGYSTRAALNYIRPAIGPNSKFGLSGTFNYSEFKEYTLTTEKDKQIFVKDENNPVYTSTEFGIACHFRKTKLWNLDFGLNVFFNRLQPELALNYPDFFLKSDSIQNYGMITFRAKYLDIDHQLNPTRGLSIEWIVSHIADDIGLSHNYLSVSQNLRTSWKLFNKCYLSNGIYGRFSVDRAKRPYNIYKTISYTDTNISGYEYYIINGLDHLFINNEIRYSLLRFHWKLFKIFKNEPVFRISSEVGLSYQLSAGYVNDPYYFKHNDLVNTLLYSTGIGLNFTVNDQFEFNVMYSVNHRKETGLYFHTRKAF